MDKLEPPAARIFDWNVAEQWKIWRQELELYLTATESDEKGDTVKTSILLSCIGKKGREIYNNFTTEGDKFKLDIVLDKFKNIVTQGRILHSSDIDFSLVNKVMDKLSKNLSQN